ncbi:MAG: class I SAM-dependent methyltransferase [Planctomycetota bacterium]
MAASSAAGQSSSTTIDSTAKTAAADGAKKQKTGTKKDGETNNDGETRQDAKTKVKGRVTRPRPVEEAQRVFMGRRVAMPMSHFGAGWLIRNNRNEQENVVLAEKNLGLKPGDVACDIGCGNGFWTLKMAKTVGKEGAVFAVDIQPEMLEKLKRRSASAGIGNVRPILGSIHDPKLPENSVDLVMMVDVYHEFSHPQSMLWAIRRSLKPTGVVALLEYRLEDPEVPIKLLHKMDKPQIMKEYRANGLKLVREFNGLPWQHMMFFARDDSPLPEIQPKAFVRK